MSRFSKIIDQLEDLNQQDLKAHQDDLKNSSQVFAIAAHLYKKLDQLANPKETKPQALLTPRKITKEYLIKTFGSYDGAYQAYQQKYGIKCRKSWKNLLALIQNLEVPKNHTSNTEERLKSLEEKVDLLMEILLNTAQ